MTQSYIRQVGELETASKGDDNDPISILENKQEIDDATKKTLSNMSKLQSTKEFARKWQSVMVTGDEDLSTAFDKILGSSASGAALDDFKASLADRLRPIKAKYAALTCTQACFRRLRDGESRDQVIAEAERAALALCPVMPEGIAALLKICKVKAP